MIKRTYLLTILLIVCLLTGCGNKTEKMCRIEIRNENSTDVITLEQQSQADVDDWQYVKFYKPVSCRFVRMTYLCDKESASNSYVGCNEFNAIASN